MRELPPTIFGKAGTSKKGTPSAVGYKNGFIPVFKNIKGIISAFRILKAHIANIFKNKALKQVIFQKERV